MLIRVWQEWNGNGFLANTESSYILWQQEYIHPDDQQHVTSVINEAIREKSIFQLEHRVIQADGDLGWTFSRAVPIMDEKGEIVEWFGSARDITESKRQEEHLAFLAEISKGLAFLSSADEIMQWIGAKIGKYLKIKNWTFVEINEVRNEAFVKYAWDSENVTNRIGIHKLSTFVTQEFLQAVQAGKTVIINNEKTDSRTDAEGYGALNIHANITVPYYRSKALKYI